MIKLKDILKEWTDDSFKNQTKRCSKSMEDTKDGLTEHERLEEKKVELYFRDDLKNKPIFFASRYLHKSYQFHSLIIN